MNLCDVHNKNDLKKEKNLDSVSNIVGTCITYGKFFIHDKKHTFIQQWP